jgi:hypothetical protein
MNMQKGRRNKKERKFQISKLMTLQVCAALWLVVGWFSVPLVTIGSGIVWFGYHKVPGGWKLELGVLGGLILTKLWENWVVMGGIYQFRDCVMEWTQTDALQKVKLDGSPKLIGGTNNNMELDCCGYGTIVMHFWVHQYLPKLAGSMCHWWQLGAESCDLGITKCQEMESWIF